MPPRAIKHQLTCPFELTSGSFLIGRIGNLVIPRNRMVSPQAEHSYCIVTYVGQYKASDIKSSYHGSWSSQYDESVPSPNKTPRTRSPWTKSPRTKPPFTKSPGQNPPAQNPPGQNPPSIFYIIWQYYILITVVSKWVRIESSGLVNTRTSITYYVQIRFTTSSPSHPTKSSWTKSPQYIL